MSTETKKPQYQVFTSGYVFERAQHKMDKKGYSASMVVYQPDGTVKVRWRKR